MLYWSNTKFSELKLNNMYGNHEEEYIFLGPGVKVLT